MKRVWRNYSRSPCFRSLAVSSILSTLNSLRQLTVSIGDLGTTAKEVEKALDTNFTLASRWGCILLLDEADVFLAERTKEDFKRNGLVAATYSTLIFLQMACAN
jgi:hypothetical protein